MTGLFTAGTLLQLHRTRTGSTANDSKKCLLILVVLSCLVTLALAAPLESQAQFKVSPLTNPLESLAQSSNKLLSIDTYKAPSTGDNDPRTYKELLSRAKEKGSVRIIVGLKASFKPEGELDSRKAVSAQRSRIFKLQQSVLSKLSARKATSVKGVKRFKFIPAMAMEVNARALKEVNSLQGVARVSEDTVVRPALSDSVPLIGADNAWEMGYSGQGQTVAVIDSGVDKEHPFLAGKVVSEACYSTDSRNPISQNMCPGEVVGAYEGAGVPCPKSGCDHGTHVAGIAAGSGSSFSGVAKDADLISIMAFSWSYNPINGWHLSAWWSDIISGIERVYELRDDYNIASLNMSIGDGSYSAPCDSDFAEEKEAIDNLRSVGIATTVSSGNGYYASKISAPACISSAVSVGATTKSDEVSDFSNSADILDLLAPGSARNPYAFGEGIYSSVPGGGFAYKSGTSMAAPHVAGAWAVLKSQEPEASVDKVLNVLKGTGIPVTDTRSGANDRVKPRIQVDAAIQVPDDPINIGRPEITGSPYASRNLSCSQGTWVNDPESFTYQWLRNGTDIIFATSSTYTLVEADAGAKVNCVVTATNPAGDAVAASSSVDVIVALDLITNANVRIDGAATSDYAGMSVSDAGDVNGDGREDLIFGAIGTDNNDRYYAGSAYVIYGSASLTSNDLNDLGSEEGFRIDGAADYDNAGISVSGAGDVNGDGLDDVIVGARYADNNDRYKSGSAYVIYGSASPMATIDLERLGSEEGFRIDGAAEWDNAGYSVSDAGDVNGDGRDDVILGANYASNNGRPGSGSAYVIYGSASPANIDLNELGSEDGFRIDGAVEGDNAGRSVSDAGDVNGDGRDDVILGAYGAGNNDRPYSGSAYVIYGSATPANIDLNELGIEDGFRIDGAVEGDHTGYSVSDAGDVNGDGRDDVVLGANYADSNDGSASGSAYVIYGSGSPANIDLNELGIEDGFRIDGATRGDSAGWSVSDAGDVNGDGRGDVIVGAYNADYNGRNDSGSAYVIYGSESSATIDLERLGSEEGFRIDGAAVETSVGYSGSGAGDQNGDGRDDVIVGAPYADNNGRPGSGSAYMIYVPEQEIVTDPACTGDPNDFAIFDLAIDTPDTLDEYAVSSVTAEFLACGASVANWPPSGSPGGYEASSLTERIEMRAPPGVEVNPTANLVEGSYVGSIKVNVLSWDGSIDNPINVPDIELVLKVDETGEGRDCPEGAVACYKGMGSSSGDSALSGHNWLWVTENAGNYTLTIGEFHNDTTEEAPAGITKVSDFLLCGYAGRPGGRACGDGSDQSKWMQRNGISPYGDETTCTDILGRYYVTAINRAGRESESANFRVRWQDVPDDSGFSVKKDKLGLLNEPLEACGTRLVDGVLGTISP